MFQHVSRHAFRHMLRHVCRHVPRTVLAGLPSHVLVMGSETSEGWSLEAALPNNVHLNDKTWISGSIKLEEREPRMVLNATVSVFIDTQQNPVVCSAALDIDSETDIKLSCVADQFVFQSFHDLKINRVQVNVVKLIFKY